MKKLFVFTLSLLSINAFSQDEIVLKADDGKEFTVGMISNHADDVQPLSVWLGGALGPNKVAFGGASYYIPQKHLFQIHVGYGFGAEGVYYFNSKEKNYEMYQSVGYEANTVYKAKLPAVKTASFGAHYGVSVTRDLFDFDNSNASLIVGGAFLRNKHAHITTSGAGGKRRGHKFVNLYLDAMWNFAYFHKVPDNITIIPEGQTPANSQEMTQSEFDTQNAETHNPVTARLYLEGQASMWSKNGRLAFKYFFGGGLPSFKFADYTQYVMLGFGLSFSFDT